MRLKNFLLEILSILSRLLNVLTGGKADMTFSARSHVEGLWTENLIDGFFRIFGEKDHCRVWWGVELERSRRNLGLADVYYEGFVN